MVERRSDNASNDVPLPLPRQVWLDRARGTALVAMIVYHAIWDGLQFGLIDWTIERDMAMRLAAQVIAGSFLFISGLSLALASIAIGGPLIARRTFWRRVAVIGLAAAVVSAATFVALPQAPIYFGILHHIALASVVIAAVALLLPFWAVALAGIVLVTKSYVAIEALNGPATVWWGLGTRAPVTADWVPVFPWLAAGLLGFAVGRQFIVPWLESKPPKEPLNTPHDPLQWMGTNSLGIYLIHQPIIIGLIYLYQWFR